MRTRYILLTLLLLPVIVFAQTVSIGDILCTDGSTVKPAQFASSGKTAEGIVFYVNASDSEGWAVALDNQSSSIKWSSEYLYGIDLPNLPNFEDARAAMHDLNGYANTGIAAKATEMIFQPHGRSTTTTVGIFPAQASCVTSILMRPKSMPRYKSLAGRRSPIIATITGGHQRNSPNVMPMT